MDATEFANAAIQRIMDADPLAEVTFGDVHELTVDLMEILCCSARDIGTGVILDMIEESIQRSVLTGPQKRLVTETLLDPLFEED